METQREKMSKNQNEIMTGLDSVLETLCEFGADDIPYYEYIINEAKEVIRNNE